jgi:hypothetical protein
MKENEIGGIVVGCAVKMPMRLGPGLPGGCPRMFMREDGISRIINGKLE